MLSFNRVFNIVFFILILFFLGSCENNKPQELYLKDSTLITPVFNDTNFVLPVFPTGRIIDSVYTSNPEGIFKPIYAVTSKSTLDTSSPFNSQPNGINIYVYDTLNKRYNLSITDFQQWIVGVNFIDVTGDNKFDVIVYTSSGGNDEIASNGIIIFSQVGNATLRIFKLLENSPVVRTVKGRNLILVHKSYYPELFSHAESVVYVDDLLEFRSGEFVSVKTENRSFFTNEAEVYLKEYSNIRSVRSKLVNPLIDSLNPLTDSVKVISGKIENLNNKLLGLSSLVVLQYNNGLAIRQLRTFWTSEKEFLQNKLDSNQYNELVKVYATTIE